ncbi:MAG: Wzz/FepE/Etk N-terminal domain-containing protein, partial [Verrucomicrobiales bacterium]
MSQSLPPVSALVSPPPSSAEVIREDEIDLLAAWRIIVKHRMLVAAVALLSIIATLFYIRVTPPVFQAMATLEARPLSPRTTDEELFGKVLTDGSVNVLTEEDIATTSAKLVRHEFLSKVAANLELQKQMEHGLRPSSLTKPGKSVPIETLVADYLKENIAITPVRKTRLIDVTAKHRDPAIAALIADTFVHEVIADGISSRAEFAGKKIGNLEADYQDMDARFVEAQRRIALYVRSTELREALTTT